jgi:hypothetical protein
MTTPINAAIGLMESATFGRPRRPLADIWLVSDG